MPSDNPSQRIAEISNELENLRAQSLRHPGKVAEMHQDGLGQLQIILKGLTTSAGGGGTTEAEQDTFIKDKLACEHEKHLLAQQVLLKVGTADGLARFCNDLQASLGELQVSQE